MAHVAQLAAAAGSLHSRHTQPWTSFTRSETERSANTRLGRGSQPKSKPIQSSAANISGSMICRWPLQGMQAVRNSGELHHHQLSPGLGLVSPHHLWPEDASSTNQYGVWHQVWENFSQFPLKSVKLGKKSFGFRLKHTSMRLCL